MVSPTNVPKWVPFVSVALISSATTLLGVWSYQKVHRKHVRERLRDEVASDVADEDEDVIKFTAHGKQPNFDDDTTDFVPSKKETSHNIVEEALARHKAFFGEKGLAQIRSKFVIVVGLGGVGSAAATFLVRGGIRKIRIIDFDQVSLSGMNRHACATLEDVGTPKTTCCARYFHEIAPWVDVEYKNCLFNIDAADSLLSGKPDYVLDCIDNVETKVDLLAYCHKNNIPVISSSGAASKSDPSRIQVADISMTYEDPLARSVRRLLKIKGINHGIPIVNSTEKPRKEFALLPLSEDEFQKGNIDELSSLEKFRVRILPVLGPIPAMFGNAMAAYVLCTLGGVKMEPLPVKNRVKLASQMHKYLSAVELRVFKSPRIMFSEQDMQYYYEEVFRTRTVMYPYGDPQNPVLIRWTKDKPLSWDNLALMDKPDAKKHEEYCLKGDKSSEEYWGPQVTERVRHCMEDDEYYQMYRL